MTKKSLSKIFIIMIVAGGLLGAYNYFKKVSTKKTNFIGQQNHFFNELEKEQKEIWQEINMTFGANLQAFHAVQSDEWKQTPKKSCEANNPIEALVYEIAKEFNYNTDKLIIEFVDIPNNQSSAGVGEGKLMINTAVFPKLPHNNQRFVIAHELYHLINDDNAEKEFIYNALENPKKTTPEQEALFYKYLRFQEKRADMHAAVHGKDWAELYLEYAKQGMNRCKIDNGLTHPTFKERVVLAQNILDHANAVQTI